MLSLFFILYFFITDFNVTPNMLSLASYKEYSLSKELPSTEHIPNTFRSIFTFLYSKVNRHNLVVTLVTILLSIFFTDFSMYDRRFVSVVNSLSLWFAFIFKVCVVSTEELSDWAKREKRYIKVSHSTEGGYFLSYFWYQIIENKF